jgi:hypothetical protein
MDPGEARFPFLAEIQTLMARLSDTTVLFQPRSPVLVSLPQRFRPAHPTPLHCYLARFGMEPAKSGNCCRFLPLSTDRHRQLLALDIPTKCGKTRGVQTEPSE